MAGRSSWKGYLKLSLVSVAVKGYSASSSASNITLNKLHSKCHRRIRYVKTCPEHGEVSNEEVVSGYEYGEGQFVVIETDELAKLRTKSDRDVNVDAVLPAGTVDPIYYTEKTYYLVPDGAVGQKPFSLVQQCLKNGKYEAVARVVLFGREELVLVRPVDNVLAMTALKYEAEVTHAESVAEEVDSPPLDKQELALAKTLIKAFERPKFKISAYKDLYIERLNELIEAKVAGKELVAPPEMEQPQVINLMDALKQSVANSRAAGSKSGKTAPPRRVAASAKNRKPAAAAKRRKSG